VRLVAVELAERELRIAWGERGLGAARLTAVERVPLDGGAEPLRAALAALAATRPAAVLTTVPLAICTHRLLHLPFRDRTRLLRTVPLELLGQLPVAPEDLLVATRPTGHTAGGTEMLAAAVRRADLAARGAALTEAGLTAARIDLAPIPALVLLPDTMASAALVLADGASSAVVVRRDGRIAGLRALASDVSEPGTLASEIRWTLRVFGFSGPAWCAGPDAARLHPALAAALDTPVDVLSPSPALAGAGSAEDLTACALVVGQILTEGRRSAPRVTFAGDQEDMPRRWRRPAALAAAALVLGLVDVGLVRATLVRREAALSRAAVEVAAAALPGTPVHAARAQLEEALAARRRLRPAGDVPVLEVLREVSARVPDALRLDLDELVIEPDVVRLHGQAESFDAVEGLRAALAASPLMREVVADETRTTVDGKRVEFRLRAVRQTAVGAPS
jgi:type II secretion system protein L